MLTKILNDLDLTEKESMVYLSNLRTGTTRISTIAKRAGFSRSTTYNILSSLHKKGFAIKTNKANIQYYSPTPPTNLIDLLEKRKEDMDINIKNVKNHLSQFKAISNPDIVAPKVSFYDGIEGIKEVYQDILKNGNKETFTALSLGNMAPELKEWTQNVFTSKKIKKNIYTKALVSSIKSKSYRKLDKKHLRESIVIPHKKYPFEVEIDIYDKTKTAFISYDETELMGVIIESPKIANTLKSLFTLAWDKK